MVPKSSGLRVTISLGLTRRIRKRGELGVRPEKATAAARGNLIKKNIIIVDSCTTVVYLVIVLDDFFRLYRQTCKVK